MSASPDEDGPEPECPGFLAPEVAAVAEQLVALVEEFEEQLNEGHVPPAFAERLSQLRETAERLI
jgi:hypothetical protein